MHTPRSNALQQKNLSNVLGAYINNMPFDKLIGLHLSAVGEDGITLKINMKSNLIGNPYFSCLHGGVIATAIDVAGATATLFESMKRTPPLSDKEQVYLESRVGTMNLTVDYLEPGKGLSFIIKAFAQRVGKCAVFRMEMYGEEGRQIAIGSGTYNIGKIEKKIKRDDDTPKEVY